MDGLQIKMAGIYVLNVGTASVKSWVQFNYEKTLNGMSNAQIVVDGASTGYSAAFDVNAEVNIYKSGTLKFRGKIIQQDSLTAGGLVLYANGIEIELADNKAPMVGTATVRSWTATSDNTILTTLITSVSGWTIDVTNSSSTDIDFRTSASESVWNAVVRMISDTGKDIDIDQANKKVYVYDQFTRDAQFSFIEGKNASNIMRKKKRSDAGKVIVYGKGDGVNQIKGSRGTGTPVYTIIDRNIVTDSEATLRALSEYNKLSSETKSYSLTPLIPIDSLQIGDAGNIANNSANINEEVDIVRLKISVDGNGTEKISMEVTNPAYRIASKNLAERLATETADYTQSQSSMQGSGNLSQWKGLINGNNTAGLVLTFNVGNDFEDEAGILRIDSLTVDYDIDEYRRGVGVASETSKNPNIASGTFSGQDNESTEVDDDTTFNNAISLTNTWTNFKSWNNIPEHGEAIIFHVHLVVADWDSSDAQSGYARIKHVDTSDYYPSSTGLRLLRGLTRQNTSNDTHDHSPSGALYFLESDSFSATADTWAAHTASDTHNHLAYAPLNGTCSIYIPIDPYLQDFEVQLASTDTGGAAAAGMFTAYYVVSQHKHGNGDYKTDLHKHDVVVGDDVSDAGSVNATSVNIYLDFWNGATWVNKHSVLATGKTLDTDVDLSDSGTYPDAKGYWRVRILTNNANPDLIQGIVTIKHNLDN